MKVIIRVRGAAGGTWRPISEYVLSARLREGVNREFLISGVVVPDDDTERWKLIEIDGGVVVTYPDNTSVYFDVAQYRRRRTRDGRLMVEFEAEHVSYRLTDKDFPEDNTAIYEDKTAQEMLNEIVNVIGAGTGLTAGEVEGNPLETKSFDLRYWTGRRALIDVAKAFDMEISYDDHEINMVTQRGAVKTSGVDRLAAGINVQSLEKSHDKRDDGTEKISGRISLAEISELNGYSDYDLELGDTVTLKDAELDINENLRISAYEEDLVNWERSTIEIVDRVKSLSDALIDIDDSWVGRIGADARTLSSRFGEIRDLTAADQINDDNLLRNRSVFLHYRKELSGEMEELENQTIRFPGLKAKDGDSIPEQFQGLAALLVTKSDDEDGETPIWEVDLDATIEFYELEEEVGEGETPSYSDLMERSTSDGYDQNGDPENPKYIMTHGKATGQVPYWDEEGGRKRYSLTKVTKAFHVLQLQEEDPEAESSPLLPVFDVHRFSEEILP